MFFLRCVYVCPLARPDDSDGLMQSMAGLPSSSSPSTRFLMDPSSRGKVP